MFLAFFSERGAFLFVASIASGIGQEEAALATADAHGLSEYTWREITEEEAAELQKPPLEETRSAALEALRLRKWRAKDAGISVNGIAIDTDDKGQATISGAVLNVVLDPGFTATWKTSAVDENGQSVWMELSGQMIVALSRAMTVYTEACFAVEAVKQAEIAALGTAEEIQSWLETSLDTGWPDRNITL